MRIFLHIRANLHAWSVSQLTKYIQTYGSTFQHTHYVYGISLFASYFGCFISFFLYVCWVVTILTCTYISICMKCKSNKNVYKTTLSIGRWFWYSLGYRCNCSFLSQYFIVSYLNAMKMKLELHAKKVWLIMWVASLEWMDQRLFTCVKPKHRRTVRFHCNPH